MATTQSLVLSSFGMHTIENERSEHAAAIHNLLVAAFPTNGEALLVDDLRAADALPVSLVATEGGTVLGHVGFSPISIRPTGNAALIWALAPLAVLPSAQRRGIGSELVRAGLHACAHAGCDAVVVLGDPQYYHRFGFVPASGFGLRCSFDAPPEAFMLVEFRPGSVSHHDGTVYFHPAFDRFAVSDGGSSSAKSE